MLPNDKRCHQHNVTINRLLVPSRFTSVLYLLLQFHFIYGFTVLVLSPSYFGFYSSLFHTFSFVFSPDLAPGCLPRSSTKLRIFSRPIVSVCFVFIYLSIKCVSLSFFLSRTLYIQIVSFVFFLYMLEIFHSQNVLLRSNTDDYTSSSLLPPT